jgi:hypothetical protein
MDGSGVAHRGCPEGSRREGEGRAAGAHSLTTGWGTWIATIGLILLTGCDTLRALGVPPAVDQPRRPTERPFATSANHEPAFGVKGLVERVFAREVIRWYGPDGTHVRPRPGSPGLTQAPCGQPSC